ncbi:MAG: sugar ABC transporter permease [Lachnospiraceae bacterium]|nr:sugar ABC transporter permease [Lachnospiraceae bacterium]
MAQIKQTFRKKQMDFAQGSGKHTGKKGMADAPQKHSRRRFGWNLRCLLCLLPSFAGIFVFFLLPYLRVLYYSVISDQFRRKFVWFDNYREILENEYFMLAMKNSLKLIVIGVPMLILMALLLSILLAYVLKCFPVLRDAFIFPMLVPTAAVVLVWQQFFVSVETALPIYLLFLWKNLGICLILLTSSFTTIDQTVYEAAKMDGAGSLKQHFCLTIPMIAPSIFFTVLLAIMNSFKIFKESFLYYGSKYPPSHSYTLQFYMNNNFLKFDYQSLAASSVLTSLLVLAIVGIGFYMQKRVEYS